MRISIKTLTLSLIPSLFLSSCGGGGGNLTSTVQNKTVNGTVEASKVKSIYICYSQNGNQTCTLTDEQGEFSIQVPESVETLDLALKKADGSLYTVGNFSLRNNTSIDVTPLTLTDGNVTLAGKLRDLLHKLAGDNTLNATIIDFSNVTIKNVSCNNSDCSNKPLVEVLRNYSNFTISYEVNETEKKISSEDLNSLYYNWLILIYMDADNNLDSYANKDLNEIDILKYEPFTKIVILVDKEDNNGGYIYETDENGYLKFLQKIPEPDMGDPKTLEDFILENVKKYPAKHKILILWDHGTGWKAGANEATYKVAAIDVTNNNDYLYTYELKEALSQANETFDVIGFDECLMGDLEVLYAIKDYANYIVASEQFEPADGWNYTKAFKLFTNDTTNLIPIEVAKNFVDAYKTTYKDINYPITMAVFTPKDILKITQGLNTVAEQYLSNSSLKEIFQNVRANMESLTYNGNDYGLVDLYNLALNLNDTLNGNGTEEIISTIRDLYKYTNDQNWQGLSIYFPKSKEDLDPDYFCENNATCSGYYNPFTQTLWDEVLKDYFSDF